MKMGTHQELLKWQMPGIIESWHQKGSVAGRVSQINKKLTCVCVDTHAHIHKYLKVKGVLEVSVVAKEKVEKRKEIFASGDIVGTKTVSVLPSIIKKAGPGRYHPGADCLPCAAALAFVCRAAPAPLRHLKNSPRNQEGVRAVNIRRCLRLICKTGK